MLRVHFPEALLICIPEDKRKVLQAILSNDPRPSYQDDPKRVYGLSYAGYDIRFMVAGNDLAVVDVII